MIIFETERLVVSEFEAADQNDFFAIYGNEEIMRYIRPARPKEESDQFLIEVITAYKETPGIGRWAIHERSTGTFVGSFAIIPIPDRPEKIQLGYSLIKEYWGKGFATELTHGGLEFADRHLKLDEIFGVTEIPNVPSQKVLLKAGFKDAGTLQEEDKTLLLFSFKFSR